MEAPVGGKLSFRAVCEKCLAYLHCCKNCRYYKPGLPSDCRVPNTDPIRDREGCNFCEEFALLGTFSPPSDGLKNKFHSLFKDD